jgi:hypothetical protein
MTQEVEMRQGLANQRVEKISASTGKPREEELKDQVLQRLNRISMACAPDLANELEIEVTPDELLPILTSCCQY